MQILGDFFSFDSLQKHYFVLNGLTIMRKRIKKNTKNLWKMKLFRKISPKTKEKIQSFIDELGKALFECKIHMFHR